jgi:hypothetical protein
MEDQKQETIADGLELPNSWTEGMMDILSKNYEHLDKVSDMLLTAVRQIREEEFGTLSSDLSTYEKKLILAGYYIGRLGTMHTSIQAEVISKLSGTMGNPLENLLNFLKGLKKEDNHD